MSKNDEPVFVDGNISKGESANYYFIPPVTGDYTIKTLSSSEFDTYGELKDLRTGYLYVDDNHGSGDNFKTKAHLKAGTKWLLTVSGADKSEYGDFILKIILP